MQTLAHGGHGPGPWILFFPLIWAVVVVGVVSVLRRTVRLGRGAPWGGGDGRATGDAPIAVLGRRFASGEIDEDDYRRRLAVLDERFGGKDGVV
ncbi:SHOCT domain-containing protein [Streptomyces nodosus]|uniref:Membrane protein n=1 Tax=Streptomyces nodosus TaxID=40318 RepID=A0A0B5DTG9_9ACTN|nr:SHOCT domain-containing protein [Streptomyces nodosus]AJE43971.1 membrane protein [Streptomyces nodosus]MBB4795541.1 putative membrane protein [Streptomyces nodosus]QEV42468.1 SHOCT domain-containing protein [Streptomyces nodosus]